MVRDREEEEEEDTAKDLPEDFNFFVGYV